MAYTLQEMKSAALICYNSGKKDETFDICCIALKNKIADRHIRLLFSTTIGDASLRQFSPIIKEAVLQTIGADDIDAQKLSAIWVYMLCEDPSLQPLFAFKNIKYVFSYKDWQNLEPCLNDQYFITGLKKLILADVEIEICLRNIRKTLLLNLLDKGLLKTKHLEFICALAEQCYNNEYVYFVTDEEKTRLENLSLKDPVSVAISACYASLYGKEFDQKISAVTYFRKLIQLQIKEPEREKELRPTLRTLSPIEDSVSGKVREMYEENPYPRWRSVDVPIIVHTDYNGDILVAGSGTGRYAIQTALSLPTANIQALDISLTSLAYSKRMAEVYKVQNINFFQCDILDSEKIEGQFDLVNSSGVLHHMSDPIKGWKQLIRKLKPGGIMSIGLYSTKARVVIKMAKDQIQEEGHKPDPDGIRRFRESIFQTKNLGNYEALKTFKDFFTLSDARDLLFHVQETTYTFPELKKIMAELGLEFMGLKLSSPKIAEFYKEYFPDDSEMLNLDHWDEFENKHPNSFGSMYNFVCKRIDDKLLNPTAAYLLQTGIFT